MRNRSSSARHLRVEDGLQQKVAQLFGELAPVAPVDGVEHLVGLFERVRLDGVEGLLAVPRTAAGRAQARHQIHQLLKLVSRCSHREGDSPQFNMGWRVE